MAGWQANAAVSKAREQVAALFDVPADWVFFTSGATESLQWVLQSVAQQYAPHGGHVLTFATEHAAVLAGVQQLAKMGHKVTIAHVLETGLPDFTTLEALITPDTYMVVALHVNNETGLIWPIEQLAALCYSKGILLIADTTQSAGKVHIPLRHWKLAAAVVSAHKLHGPKGVGALIVNKKAPRLMLSPLFAGSQEEGMRAGTLNVPGIVGLGAAAAYWLNHRTNLLNQFNQQRALLLAILKAYFPDMIVSASIADCQPNIVNCYLNEKGWENWRSKLPYVAASAAAACAQDKGSHVLTAMQKSPEHVRGAIRFSLGANTTVQQINMLEEYLKIAFGK